VKAGDVVMTSAIEVRTSFDKRAIRAGFKANPGHMMVFLSLGGVASDQEADGRAEKVLRALGWIPCDDIEGLRAALAEAEVTAAQAATEGDKS
jgi:hypothetical protein